MLLPRAASIDDLQMVSLKKAAQLLDVHPDTVSRLIRKDGKLRAAKIKGSIRVYLWSIDQYTKMNEIVPVSEKKQEARAPGRRSHSAGYRAAVDSLKQLGIDI
jgi:plasmid maintenance system antidote protein VapI